MDLAFGDFCPPHITEQGYNLLVYYAQNPREQNPRAASAAASTSRSILAESPLNNDGEHSGMEQCGKYLQKEGKQGGREGRKSSIS